MRTRKKGLRAFIAEHKWAMIVLLLLLAERMMALFSLGVMYSLESDDLSYINSGIYFAKTGMITMHNTYPSAQIMPGMTVLIGLFSLVLGEGKALWIALKLLWILMGVLTAWFVYLSVRIFAPKWCGIVAMLFLFRADFAWMDNLILTETPFMLALTAMIYFTLMLGKAPGYRNFWGCLIAYMAALMLKANIAPYPLLALIYLLLMHYDRKLLLKQCVILVCAVLCFVVPWSVRNYIQFHAFVPLTYGAGNPSLLGTYQGTGYPTDEELDYAANVDAVVKQKYADYYQDDGTVKPEYARYVSLQRDGIKAKYRQKMWAEKDFMRMVYSYAVLKPQTMINGIFYWETILNEDSQWLIQLQRLDLWLCVLTIVAALVLKKKRRQVLFLTAVYLVNIYIYAMTFAFSRYNASLMSLRFIIIGIGASLIIQLITKGAKAVRRFERTAE